MGTLTAIKIKKIKPNNIKDTRYPDGGGLYLFVTKQGGKLWRYNFSFYRKKYRHPS